jgi:alanine racemase
MHRTWVEISLAQIAANYRQLCAAAGPSVTVAPVVKADAYRHGALAVASCLQAEGASWLAVSSASEGVALRDALISTRILVMGDFLHFERDALSTSQLTPVIHSLHRLADYDNFARARGAVLPYHLKLDTGMGRLGTRASLPEILDAVRAASHLRLEGLMTHFASASDFSSPQTAGQVTAFENAAAAFRHAGLCPPLLRLSSSAPIAFGMTHALGAPFGTMVRPGLALYGYVSPPVGPAPPLAVDVRPALQWKARILAIKDLAPGASVGYSARWTAARPSRIAVVAAGYADGVPHTLSNRGHVIAAGRLAPLVGAVSMDLITVDVTGAPGAAVGEPVSLIGQQGDIRYDAENLARDAGIISYAVLCGIGNRVARVYLD